jgi:hypothetical protein
MKSIFDFRGPLKAKRARRAQVPPGRLFCALRTAPLKDAKTSRTSADLKEFSGRDKSTERGVLINRYMVARALAALDEIRGLLQAAQFAAYKFEQQAPAQNPSENLSDHIDRVKVAADSMRAGIQRSYGEPHSQSFRISGR